MSSININFSAFGTYDLINQFIWKGFEGKMVISNIKTDFVTTAKNFGDIFVVIMHLKIVVLIVKNLTEILSGINNAFKQPPRQAPRQEIVWAKKFTGCIKLHL